MNNQIDMVQIFDDIEESENAFHAEELSTEEKIEQVKNNFFRLWDEGWKFLCSVSMGKDSSCMAAIFLNAAVEYKTKKGINPPFFVVCSANTLLENPVIDEYSKGELRKIDQFIELHELDGRVDVVIPNLSNNYLVSILGGRTVATLPDNPSSKCSMMLKVAPIQRQKGRIFKELGADKTCTLVGTRFDESEARGRAMRERKESDKNPVPTKSDKNNQEYVLSPICEFTLDDVFYFIGLVRSELISTYSNFDSLVQVYRDGNDGGECMVTAYSKNRSHKTGCSARFGCWICGRVKNDKSLINMLKRQEYSYMKPLSNFRNALLASHYDPSKRNWLARSLADDGSIKIAPNAYSSMFCETLLKWALTVDADEWEATNGRPRFTLLRNKDVIAVDALWNRYGYQKGLTACYWWLKVNRDGERFYPPENPDVYQSKPFPREVTLPFVDDQYNSPLNGFRDFSMMTIGQETVVESPSGSGYMPCNTGPEFEISDEGAEMFFSWEIENAVERFHDFLISPVAAYQYLIRLGVVVLAKGSQSEQDRMIRMAQRVWRSGIHECLNDPIKIVQKLGYSEEVLGFQGGLFDDAA